MNEKEWEEMGKNEMEWEEIELEWETYDIIDINVWEGLGWSRKK